MVSVHNRLSVGMQFNCPHCAKCIKLEISKKRDHDVADVAEGRNVLRKRVDVDPGSFPSSSSSSTLSSVAGVVGGSGGSSVQTRATSSFTLVPNRVLGQSGSKAAAKSVASNSFVDPWANDNEQGRPDLQQRNRHGSSPVQEPFSEPGSRRGSVREPVQEQFQEQHLGDFSLDDDAPLALDYTTLSFPRCRFPTGVNVPPSWPCFGKDSPLMDVPDHQKSMAQNLEFSLYVDEKHNSAST